MKRFRTLEGLLFVAGWLFFASALVFIAYPFLTPLGVFKPLENGLPAGVLVALAAQLFTQSKNLQESREKRSLFYLDSCVKAFEEARILLEDGNNDRATWIAAGRALGHATDLADNVTADAHLRVLELHRLKYRRCFHDALQRSAAFFYGAKLVLSTDDAAKWSTAGEEGGLISTVKGLSDKALRAVWLAAQWPTGYEDPLDRGFSEAERQQMCLLFPGLHEFLDHKERWHSAAGKLYERKPTQ